MSGTGRVVAELGRPETPEETADRKARDRALRRSRQTFRNLIASVAVCVAAVVVIALALPGTGAAPARPAIDVAAVASSLSATAGRPLLAPAVPADWRPNAAQLRGTGDAAAWYVGWIVNGTGYAALTEGLPGTDAVVSDALEQADPTGTTSIGGSTWQVYDRRGAGTATGNVAYGLSTRFGDVRVAVYGTLSASAIRDLAARVAAEADARDLAGAAS